MQPQFSIQESLSAGLQAVERYPLILIASSFFVLCVDMLGNGVARFDRGSLLALFALFFVVALCGLLIRLGMIRNALLIERGEAPSWNLFSEFVRLPAFFCAFIAYAVLVIVGLLLFILPGLLLATAFSFFPFLMVDKKLGIVASFKESFALTQGNRIKLFLLFFVLLGVNTLGVLFLVVGIFVTVPLSVSAYAHVYKKLSSVNLSGSVPSQS